MTVLVVLDKKAGVTIDDWGGRRESYLVGEQNCSNRTRGEEKKDNSVHQLGGFECEHKSKKTKNIIYQLDKIVRHNKREGKNDHGKNWLPEGRRE